MYDNAESENIIKFEKNAINYGTFTTKPIKVRNKNKIILVFIKRFSIRFNL